MDFLASLSPGWIVLIVCTVVVVVALAVAAMVKRSAKCLQCGKSRDWCPQCVQD